MVLGASDFLSQQREINQSNHYYRHTMVQSLLIAVISEHQSSSCFFCSYLNKNHYCVCPNCRLAIKKPLLQTTVQIK